MLYVLTDSELAEARESLRPQLTDQTTLATAKAMVVDSLWDAIGSLPADHRAEIIAYHARLLTERWQKLPAGPVRKYFELSGPDPA